MAGLVEVTKQNSLKKFFGLCWMFKTFDNKMLGKNNLVAYWVQFCIIRGLLNILLYFPISSLVWNGSTGCQWMVEGCYLLSSVFLWTLGFCCCCCYFCHFIIFKKCSFPDITWTSWWDDSLRPLFGFSCMSVFWLRFHWTSCEFQF